MNYGFFFDYNDDTIRLPVNPEKFSISIEQDSTKKTVVGLGAINIIGDIQLQKIEFEAEFPCQKQWYITTKNQFKGPYFYLDKFKQYMKKKTPIRFVLTRNYKEAKNLKNISILVTISSIDINEEALEEGDLKVKISLLEYKMYKSGTVKIKTKKKKVVTAKKKKARASKSTTNFKTYVVKKGDCLWNIAKKFYGKGSEYKKIYNANKKKIKNPNLIYPGQILTIP